MIVMSWNISKTAARAALTACLAALCCVPATAQFGRPVVTNAHAIEDVAVDGTGVSDIASSTLPNIGQTQHRLTVFLRNSNSDPCLGLGLVVLQASFDGDEWFTAGQGINTLSVAGVAYVDVTATYPAVRAYVNNLSAPGQDCTLNVHYTGTVNPVDLSKVNPPGWDYGMITASRSLEFSGAESQDVIDAAEDSVWDLPTTYSICIYGGWISTDATVALSIDGPAVSSDIYMQADTTFNFGQSQYPIICRSPNEAFTIETDGAANLGMMIQYRYELR